MNIRNLLLTTALFSCGLVSPMHANATTSATQAELRVNAAGMVRVSYEDLVAQGIDWSGVAASTLRLSRGSTTTPLRYEGAAVFGPGSAVTFFGEAISDSIYTKTAVYRLSVGGVGSPALADSTTGRGSCRKHGGTRDTFVHDPDRGYDMGSSHTSPWYAQRVVRWNVPQVGTDETFTIVDRASATQADHIEVGLWGGTEYSANPDHSVRLLLNGTVIATRKFDGLVHEKVSVALPPDTLRNGANTLRLELVGDTGVAADVVYLDDIKVEYTRTLNAVGNRLAFSNAAAVSSANNRCSGNSTCSKYLINGLASPDFYVFRGRSNGVIEQVVDVSVNSVAGGYEACFISADAASDRYWVEPVNGSVTATITPKAAAVDPLGGPDASYLIVSHASFMDGLAPLIAARRQDGYSVRVVDVADIYDYYNKGTVDPDAIGAAIADAYQRLGTRYVLLVGGDTYDYFNVLGGNARSFLPTYYLPNSTVVRFAPTDHPFADVDADGLADVAIGRFPVRTLAELDSVIAKTLTYGQGTHARKLLKVSDRNDGVPYEGLLSSIDGALGANTMTTNITLDNYANSSTGLTQARADLASAVNAGHSLTTYFGHAGTNYWVTSGLVTTANVNAGLFNNASAPTVMWVMGCYGTYFTGYTGNSLAPALMVQPNGGGAAAVIGSTSLTYVNSQVDWMRAMSVHINAQTLGEAMRLTQRALKQAGPQYADLSTSGVLLGDPALRVR